MSKLAHDRLVELYGTTHVERSSEHRARHAALPQPAEKPYQIGSKVRLLDSYFDNHIQPRDKTAVGVVKDVNHGQAQDDVRTRWYYWVVWEQVPTGFSLSSEPGLIVHLWHHDRLEAL